MLRDTTSFGIKLCDKVTCDEFQNLKYQKLAGLRPWTPLGGWGSSIQLFVLAGAFVYAAWVPEALGHHFLPRTSPLDPFGGSSIQLFVLAGAFVYATWTPKAFVPTPSRLSNSQLTTLVFLILGGGAIKEGTRTVLNF